MIWDTHTHLNDKRFHSDQEAVIKRAQAAGVDHMVNIGFDEHSSRESLALAQKYDFIYAAVGVHPHDAKSANQATWDALSKLAAQPRTVAWGEIGLDYYRDLSPRDVQQRVFIEQIELANEAGLPIIIHDRAAHGDVLKIIREHRAENGGIFHSYAGSWEMAKEILKLGYYISFSGPVTYKNARQTVEVAENVPADRFLLETDCPYLTPEPLRGKRNEPAYVLHTAAKVAELRQISVAEAGRLSTENVRRLFGL
jgi:TatD DNase family protein